MRSGLFCICFVFCCCGPARSQYSTENKRAIGKFEIARRNFQLLDYRHAEENLREALDLDTSFIEAYLLLGQLYADTKQVEKSIGAYESAVRLDSSSYPRLYLFLAGSQLAVGRYSDARRNTNLFILKGKPEGDLAKRCSTYLRTSNFGIEAMEHPVPFEPVNLGGKVNSRYDEYFPSLSADEKMLVFTVLLPLNTGIPGGSRYMQEDFYYSKYEHGMWSQAKDAGTPLNTVDNEGAQTITGDGKIMVFTACNRDEGYGLCDLYISGETAGRWTIPVNMGAAINTKYSEKQPSISADGTTLYFSSDRPGGKGAYDIWYTRLSDDGNWQEPVNLGDSINTPGIDQTPFIHPDNKTLYFSSDGWPGMGGYDLFVSRKGPGKSWSAPVNLGYPINTWNDEEGLIVNARGNKAYYSSDRLKERGRDIYEFELYQEVRPVLVSYMKGSVYDAVSGSMLAADLELIDLGSGEVVMRSVSHLPGGDFLICIPADADYALNVSKPGYLFYSEHFSMDSVYERSKPFLMDVPLKPIREGEKIVLKNVFFDHDSYTLKAESRVELDKVIEFLGNNPSLHAEISGHTDNTGTAVYNQELSEKRAGEVVRYLTEHDVDPSRLSHRGYGLEQPVADNNTREGRALNRRTELKITSK